MADIVSQESLMIRLINHLSEVFGSHAILKGGMVLRLMDCPRSTNDLDYVFIPYQSKKDIVPLIRQALERLPDTRVEVKLHSTHARFLVTHTGARGTFRAQIEASVAKSCPAEPLSTGSLSLRNGEPPHVVTIMRLDVALAHKLAAWNERGLARDLYDAYFLFRHLGKLPDRKTLSERLSDIVYAKSIKTKGGTRQMTLEEFCAKLQSAVRDLNERAFEREIGDYLAPQELPGLCGKVKIALTQLIERLCER